jgi:hypothetical protein
MYSNKQARRDSEINTVSYLVVVVQLDRVPLAITDPTGNNGMDHGLRLSWRRERKRWGERERGKEGERNDRKDKRDGKEAVVNSIPYCLLNVHNLTCQAYRLYFNRVINVSYYSSAIVRHY